jgi:hypothetical protein
MSKSLPDKQAVLNAIRNTVAQVEARRISRQEFLAHSGMKVSDIFRHFPKWSAALSAAGFDFEPYHERIRESDLLQDWGKIVRKHRAIPTRNQYKLEGKYSPGVFESRYGPWSVIPSKFRDFAQDRAQWADVLALLPEAAPKRRATAASRTVSGSPAEATLPIVIPRQRHRKLEGRPMYGNPIDFRGLRHEPVNEQGVVFLFGMVAKELGYMVEAVQAGFPDCEAKCQVGPNKYQRVRIEFEFESREFRDHGHPEDGCDVIVCWRHNWPECPTHLEVIELASIIKSLAKSED